MLTGSWELVSCVYETGDRRSHPYGERPRGVLVYGADGGMSVTIAHERRAPIGDADFRGGDDAAKARALDSFAGYGGTWRLVGDVVEHRIHCCSFPDWRGLTQRRHVTLRDDLLELRTDPVRVEGEIQVATLVWRRMQRPS